VVTDSSSSIDELVQSKGVLMETDELDELRINAAIRLGVDDGSLFESMDRQLARRAMNDAERSGYEKLR
jgi:hypothetical protein